jgi:phosphopantetheinyl transferase
MVPSATSEKDCADVGTWWGSISDTRFSIDGLRGFLSPEEITRAARFIDRRAMGHFVLGRAALRRLLGERLRVEPSELQFRYGAFGKPELAGSEGLHFSVSHSGDLVVIAIASRIIGVNIEFFREKALGCGLAIPLNALEVTFGPSARATVEISSHLGVPGGRWFAYELELGRDYFGMLVADSPSLSLGLHPLDAW